MNANRRRWLLLGLVLAAYAGRVAGLDRQSLWRDEVDAIYFAVRDLSETLGMFIQAAQNGPLYFLALRAWFALMGTTEFVLRYPSVIAGTLSVPLLWQVARRLLPERHTGVLAISTAAMMLMAFNPYQVWYGQEGKMYATVTCLALLATWFWLRGVDQGGWRPWTGYLITVSAALYTHLLMVLIIPVHIIWYFLAWPASRVRWRGYALALAGLTLPYLPMAWWHWWLLTAPEKLSGFSFTPLAKVAEGLLLSHARGFLNTVNPLWLTPIFFIFGAGILLGVTEVGDGHPGGAKLAPWRRFAMLAVWLLLPVALIYVISLRQPVFTERYLIWIGPAAIMTLALGLRVIAANSGRLALAVAAGFMAYTLIFWTYANWQQKTTTIKYDLRSAVAYIQANRDPNTLLVLQIPHQEWSYRYYSSDFGPNPFADSDLRLGRWVGGPYTNYGQPDDQARAAVDAQLRPATADGGDVWVMLSEVELWDARRLTDDWFDRHGFLVEHADFPGVQVRRYQMK